MQLMFIVLAAIYVRGWRTVREEDTGVDASEDGEGGGRAGG